MKQWTEVGRVTPSTLRSSAGLVSALGISATEGGCAPSVAVQESVVAVVGAQRTARPTFGFVESGESGCFTAELFVVRRITEPEDVVHSQPSLSFQTNGIRPRLRYRSNVQRPEKCSRRFARAVVGLANN